MKPLFTEEQFEKAKTTDKLPCECYVCKKTFTKQKRVILRSSNNEYGHVSKYCSQKCKGIDMNTRIVITCATCEKQIKRKLCASNKSKSGKNFCSNSCAATYNNKHKTTGTRRSKLEIWLESQLTKLYPNKKILFNNVSIINSELDIYFPSLKLAFELNGIVHYEPIYGQSKLDNIKNNDDRKFQACLERGIELCIIDSSQMKYFKESNCKKYLDIITDIISKKDFIMSKN